MTVEEIRALLSSITDPEIPVITIEELGVLRDVAYDGEQCVVTITPTYSGCPAMNMIEMQIKMVLDEAGISDYKVKTVLTPAWTTDWMTEEARQKLKAYGIAPPQGNARRVEAMLEDDVVVPCPHCGSEDTKKISQFGSTACKAMYQCNICLEPFDYFKCH